MSRHVTFRDKDVFPDKNISEEGIVYEDRPAGRAILFDDEKNIALKLTIFICCQAEVSIWVNL